MKQRLKRAGAKGVMKLSNTSVQVIVGTNVESVADDMKTRINNEIRGCPKD